MTPEPPDSEHDDSSGGASGGGRPSSGIAPVRAFVVLVIFVVAAIALVTVGSRPSVSGNATTPGTTTPSTAPHRTTSTTTTTTTTIARASVKVVVANATHATSLAAHYSTQLGAQGWAMQAPLDATTTVATSAVYYAAGQQGSAAAIAASLGLKPAAVMALTTAVPVAGVSGDDVVVVAGADLAAQAAS
jgi:hypothetical protein